MKVNTSFLYFISVIFILSCSSSPGNGNDQTALEEAFPNLEFTRPVDMQFPNDNSNRLLVVEQQGVIYTFENNRDVTTKKVFLDIRDKVDDRGNEEGLLGLAFHPDYQSNGYFYVDYTASNPDRTVIARYEVSATNRDSAVVNSEFVILEVEQPYSNHNAGQILFGMDGYFYITLGDGGSGGDPQGNGQNLGTLLGSILRIDVDQTSGDRNYGIPTDNPFVANQREFREEIYAYGLRNPWRISFDPETQWLWAADVGQNQYEEIDIIEKGKNYGWNIMEGFHCYNTSSCDTAGLELPIWEYDHSLGLSITGGFVYRGARLPELVGKYIYADYVSGRIWALEYDGTGEPSNSLLINTDLNISSFGIDQNNMLYMLAFDGKIYRFKAGGTGVMDSKNIMKPALVRLAQNYPNPFNSNTTITYHLEKNTNVVLEIYDILGRLIRTLVQGHQLRGEKIVVWDGRDIQNKNVQSGIYFYKLKTGGFEKTKKMVLLQ
ncbi:T9SS type A sorting domain-containing protein [candidate division KSB1 bacterium]|nr:T9SS type A sorting domain-containing protein [candidate division KSB1 bacterium]